VFFGFRIMVGLGGLMIAAGLTSLWLRFRGKLFDSPRFALIVLLMAPSGLIALLSGWFVTEVGRQPYTVYGLLRTADSASPIGAPGVAGSLIAFGVVYVVVFGAGVYYLIRLVRSDPEKAGRKEPEGPMRAAGITPIQTIVRPGSSE
jgi:cytochrome d ubiquinol oxidase subunit I